MRAAGNAFAESRACADGVSSTDGARTTAAGVLELSAASMLASWLDLVTMIADLRSPPLGVEMDPQIEILFHMISISNWKLPESCATSVPNTLVVVKAVSYIEGRLAVKALCDDYWLIMKGFV